MDKKNYPYKSTWFMTKVIVKDTDKYGINLIINPGKTIAIRRKQRRLY